MLKEKTLFEYRDKVKEAIDILKDLEPKGGYYLADSGGKDSTVILELARMSGVNYDSHYNVTTIDPPELIYFLREHHKETIFERPEKPLLQKMIEKGVYPSRKMRWCCELYKEKGGVGRLIITGVRKGESVKRSKRKMVENCMRGGNKRYLNIIINWSDDEVWEFIKGNNIPYCSLYDEGFKRLGCLMCPMANGASRKKEAERYPNYVKMFIKAFEKMHEKKVTEEKRAGTRWKSGKEWFWWWMDDNRKSEDPDQTIMFE